MFVINTINCNGLQSSDKMDYLKDVLIDKKVDICLVQETHIDNIVLGNFVEKRLNYRCFWSLTDNNKHKGVGILISKHLDCRIVNFSFDSFGRYVYVDISLNDFDIRIISVYAPNNEKERKSFFQDIYPIFLSKKEIILGGDFNCVSDLTLDKKGGNINRGNIGWEQLFCILKDFNLIDPFRKKYPCIKEFTWFSQTACCRLDRFYISNVLFDNDIEISHDLYSLSDHHLVYMKLSPFNHQKVGQSYWKFNRSLLDNPDYIDFMTMFLKNNVSVFPSDESLLEWWDNLKVSIRSVTIQFSKNERKHKRYYKNCLRKEYFELEKSNLHTEANVIKEQIKNIDLENIKGAQIRSKALNLEGENPSRYFLRKELQNGKRKHIKKIIDDNKIYNDSIDILNCFKTYYTELYSRENVDKEAIKSLLSDVPTISDDEKKNLGKQISTEEIKKSLHSFQNDKTPGSDGLTKEFYVAFEDIFVPIFYSLYSVIYQQGHLSNSQKLSYISLLCKKDSNPDYVNSYRPISLLNVDYKILTKTLSKRLEQVLEHVIHSDQTCSVPQRSIIDSCHLIRDIIDYAELKNINGILLSLDQEKAFDRVAHDYLFDVLKAFGLGNNFTHWIQTIYNDVYSSVIVNQFISDPFPVLRSVRQGCCLSPMLYILCLEPVLIKIRKDANIKGFKIPGKDDQKVIAFADDSNFSVLDDISVEKIFVYFDLYSKASGAKLNKTKSKGFFLGKWKTRSDHPFGISWIQKIKIFGVLYGNITLNEIWNPVYCKIKQVLNLYKTRCLSLYGKACVVNVMVLSKLWYLASVVYVPDVYLNLIEKEIFAFIWGENKMELINRNSCYFPKKDGGLSLVNIRIKILSIQIAQVSKVIYNENLAWTFFANVWLGISLRRFNDYSFTNLIPHCIEDLPSFYENMRSNLYFLKDLDKEIVPVKNSRCKLFYRKLIDIFVERNDLNVSSKFTNIDFQKAFSNVNNKHIDPLALDVTYKMCHNVLPVAYRLHRFGINIDKMCSFCKNDIETTEHLFFYCMKIQKCKRILA